MITTVEHNGLICPMCEWPITSTVRPISKGIRVTVTCNCPLVEHSLIYPPTKNEEQEMHARESTARSHIRDRAIFRDGFDCAMRVVHKFAEQHLPTKEPEVWG